MKYNKSYILGMAAAAAMAVTGCSTEFDPVPVQIPSTPLEPNTTLLELKTKYWDDATNYIMQIGTVDGTEDGEHVIIHGRVISNDIDGNVFKSLIIQDETCALAFSINQYNLYLDYRPGQEIVVDATGMEIGKYNGLQQMGRAEWYENGSAWEASFMAPQFFKEHAHLSGLPNVALIDTIQINSFAELPATPEGLRQFQSQLVRFNNVHFEDGGKEQFSVYKSSGENRNLIDSEGQSLLVRTSGYSKFWNKILPEGDGDVVCILGYYGTTGWQLTLIDYDGCMNFGNPTIAPGTETNPLTVTEAIEVESNGTYKSGWVKGYIVGTVAPEVTSIAGSNDIEWSAEPVLANTMVIAPTPDCTDIAQCLVFELPQDSKLRQYGCLRDNPDNYKKEITIFGKLEPYMGSWGLTGNNGSADLFHIEGLQIGGTPVPDGNGTQASPYSPAQIIKLNPTDTQTAVESGVWVSGYIVGSMPTGGSSTLLSGTTFGTADAATTNVVIAPTADCTDYTKCIGIQLPTGIRDAINLSANPGNLGKLLSIKGDIMKYCGGPGVKNGSEYTLTGEGSGEEPPTPPTPGTGDDFNAGNGSQATPYNTTQIVAMNPSDTQTAVESGVWTVGYILGSIPTGGSSTLLSNTVFGTTDAATTNLVIGPTPDCKDYKLCVGIQLPVAIRDALNLSANPGNLGKVLAIKGDVMKYCGGPGIKNGSEYTLTGEGSSDPGTDPGTGDDPVTPPSGDAVNILATALTNVPGATTVNGYTIDIQKNGGTTQPTLHAGTSAIRVYAKGTVTVSGAQMASITFTLASDAGFRYTTVTPSTGSISPAQATGDTSFTWVGNASEVTFTVGDTASLGSDGDSKAGQLRFSAIDIVPAK